MRVLIETQLFAPPQATAELVQLFLLGVGVRGRHRIQVEDDRTPELQAWLRSLGRELEEACREAINSGYELESREPSRIEVRVARVEAPDFSCTPPRLPLTEALRLLSRPFRVITESDRNDRSFLLCMCTEEQRGFLLRYENEGFLEFEHGGGLDHMYDRALELGTGQLAAMHPLVTWLLFDSDALQAHPAGRPSAKSNKLKETCEQAKLPHHQLRRRFIESYLPLRAIAGWADLAPNREGREQRRQRFEAFARLKRPEQRHHFNLKKGFAGDRERHENGETAGTLFDDVSEADKQALEHGFGKTLANTYDPPGQKVAEVDLRNDGGWAELAPVISTLIALIR